MDDLHLGALITALLIMLVLGGFFSASETGLMALNRYRLRHKAKSGHKGAQRASKLLEQPDRLIGLILLGNNFANIMASSLATLIAIHFLGEAGIALAALVMTFVVLIFGEVAPKTVAVVHPERIAYPAATVLTLLMKLCYPVVWTVNMIANSMLRLFGLTTTDTSHHALSPEELRTVVIEAGVMIPRRYQSMLLSILDLEEITVDDIMIPRNEIAGIDLEDPWETLYERLTQSLFTHLLVYRENIDQVVGFIHLRRIVGLMAQNPNFGRKELEELIREPYFIPEGTPLSTQLLNFQKERRHYGLVVSEYGDLLGLVTLEDILEEIVGEFTTDPLTLSRNIVPQPDGGYLVDGSTSVRMFAALDAAQSLSRAPFVLFLYLAAYSALNTGLLFDVNAE